MPLCARLSGQARGRGGDGPMPPPSHGEKPSTGRCHGKRNSPTIDVRERSEGCGPSIEPGGRRPTIPTLAERAVFVGIAKHISDSMACFAWTAQRVDMIATGA